MLVLRRLVVAGHELGVEAHDDVEQEVAEGHDPHGTKLDRVEGDSRRARLRSFAIGGLVGAAGVLATARRSSLAPVAATRRRPGGLAAFEDAPCFLELVGEEAQRYREGGETTAGTSNPT